MEGVIGVYYPSGKEEDEGKRSLKRGKEGKLRGKWEEWRMRIS